MSNLKGPSEGKRKLYATAITSIVTYAAPVWATVVKKNPYTKKFLNKFDRTIAQRVCCAYKTVSGVAALMIAGMISTVFMALKLEAAYRVYKIRSTEEDISHLERVKIGQNALRDAKLSWFDYLISVRNAPPGVRTKDAIMPSLEKWYNRSYGTTSFYITQIITGHGCFKEFLHKIKKADSPVCDFCSAGQDSAQHTLEFCNKWNKERSILMNGIGCNLDLNSIIGIILENAENWACFSRFCTDVLRRKEEAEREEERMRRIQH